MSWQDVSVDLSTQGYLEMDDSSNESHESNEADAVPESLVDFDSIRLHAGAPVQIEHLNWDGLKYTLKYVGAIKGKSVLLTLPVVDGEVTRMYPGQSYVIRGFDGKHAYAFTSRVIQARTRPFAYVHFAYPDSVEYKVVRKALRVTVNLPAEVVGEGEQMPVTMLDLSENGSMIDAPKPIGEISATVNVQFDVVAGGTKSRLKLPARIRNARHSKEAGSIHVGVEFENIPKDDMLVLDNFILHHSVDIDV